MLNPRGSADRDQSALLQFSPPYLAVQSALLGSRNRRLGLLKDFGYGRFLRRRRPRVRLLNRLEQVLELRGDLLQRRRGILRRRRAGWT